MSKTAVSRLVGDLEARLGTRLLHRTTRRLSLTPEGEVFHDRCRQLLDGVAEVEGHDVDKGVANIFILTNAPSKLWERLEPLVEDSDANELDALAAAYRKVDGETFTVLWPTDYEGEFEVS